MKLVKPVNNAFHDLSNIFNYLKSRDDLNRPQSGQNVFLSTKTWLSVKESKYKKGKYRGHGLWD
ncbi:MAG TPA: hypothetical protein VGQ53_18945 [Chitinophagaceae bacterium]|jgi:hypothetical protein|nr:hypothetical protein [Chitinophagaceae bacterium]